MPFDINSARKAGYSDNEIADFLASQNPKFDINGARKAGYSDAEIVHHLSTPQQMSGVLREPALLGSNIVKGAASLATIPDALTNLEDKYVAAPLARTIMGEPADFGTPGGAVNPFLKPSDVYPALQKMGITDRSDLIPQNMGERLLASAGQGAGATVPIALTGGVAAAPLAAAQGGGGGYCNAGYA